MVGTPDASCGIAEACTARVLMKVVMLSFVMSTSQGGGCQGEHGDSLEEHFELLVDVLSLGGGSDCRS